MNDEALSDAGPEEAVALPDVEEVDLPDVEVESDDYWFVDGPERALRCFIIEHMGSPEIEGKVLVANMQAAFEWIMDGTVPQPAPKSSKNIKAV